MITYNPEFQTYYSTLIAGPHLQTGFGTREVGDGRQVGNISAFLKENGIAYDKIVTLEQIHSANIAFFKGDNALPHEVIADTDAVITRDKKTALMVATADCVPIIYYEATSGMIGISHQGWRGTLHRMQQKVVKKMSENGAKVKNIRAAVGPSIGACCYNIDESRHEQFLEEFENYAHTIFVRSHHRWHLDLTALNVYLLEEAGLARSQIDFFPFCTSCNRSKFFSLRRKQIKHNDFERQFNFIIKT